MADASQRPADEQSAVHRATDDGSAGGMLADPAYRFAAMVIVAGCAAVVMLAVGGGFAPLAHVSPRLVIFMLLAFAGELWLVRMPTRTSWTLISASSLFTLATLLAYGAGPALIALGLGSIVKDVRARRPAIKLAFNVAQHVLSVGAAWGAFVLLAGEAGQLAASELPAAA